MCYGTTYNIYPLHLILIVIFHSLWDSITSVIDDSDITVLPVWTQATPEQILWTSPTLQLGQSAAPPKTHHTHQFWGCARHQLGLQPGVSLLFPRRARFWGPKWTPKTASTVRVPTVRPRAVCSVLGTKIDPHNWVCPQGRNQSRELIHGWLAHTRYSSLRSIPEQACWVNTCVKH